MEQERTLLTIDPGVHRHALAHFRDGTLYETYTIPASDDATPFSAQRVVIERPELYNTQSEKNPNDIVDLALAAGRIGGIYAAAGSAVKFVKPREWKGQVKKPIHHARVFNALTAAELDVLADALQLSVEAIQQKIDDACDRLATTGKVTRYSWDAHNILDAVGLGLWAIGRTKRGGAR